MDECEKLKNQDEYYANSYVDINKIRDLRLNRKFDEVYNLLKDMYEQNPSSAFILKEFLIAVIDYKPQDSALIKKIADEVLETKYKDIAYYGLVMYYLSVNNAYEAAKYYKFITGRPNLYNKIQNRVCSYECQREFRDLIFDLDHFKSMLTDGYIKDKRYTYISYDIASYYLKNKDFSNAIKYFKLSLEKRVGQAKGICYYRIGTCYNQLANYGEGYKYLHEALSYTETESDRNKIITELTISLYKLERYDEVLSYCEHLSKGNKADKNISLCMKVKVYTAQKKYNEALDIANNITDMSRIDRKSLLIDLTRIYKDLKQFDLAFKYMNELYEIDPNYNPLLKAGLLSEANMHYENIEYCKTFYGTKHENGARRLMGKSYLSLRDYENARAIFEELIAKENNYDDYYDLGRIYEKLDLFEESFDALTVYIHYKEVINDKNSVSKGIIALVDLLVGQYKFDDALVYLKKLEISCPNFTDQINIAYASYYLRKQEYENSAYYYNKLMGSKYADFAKNKLVVLYRYNNDLEKSNSMMDELVGTKYEKYNVLNKVKMLKDEGTKDSFIKALYELTSLKKENGRLKTMAVMEEIEILVKLEHFDKAIKRLEESFNDGFINERVFKRYTNYIKIKRGEEIDEEDSSIFLNFCKYYNKEMAFNNIFIMNESNIESRECYLTVDEIKYIFDEIENNYQNLKYYVNDLYDIYVVDMEKPVGKFYGVETNLVEIKCEQNTHNIHCVQPTLKKINLNKLESFTRKKVDLHEE